MNPDVLDAYRRAGRIAAQALQYGARLITVGTKVSDVLDQVETFITEHGGGIAFPAQASINNTAAHACPPLKDETVFKEGDVVKLDIGVHINGYVGDNALTVYLGDDPDVQRLVEASKAARDAAIALVKAGVTPHQLGEAIQREIAQRGFTPVVNLSGHGLDQYTIHTSPSIPNYPNNDHEPLKAGQVIAIEPFASAGRGRVHNGDEATLFSLQRVAAVRSPIARQLLERIKGYNGLPFTTRWLEREFGTGKAKLGLLQLKQAGLLHEYPPLLDAGLVSQWEHTMLVEEEGCTILTLPE